MELSQKEIEALIQMAIKYYGGEEQLRDAIAWFILDKQNEEAFQ